MDVPLVSNVPYLLKAISMVELKSLIGFCLWILLHLIKYVAWTKERALRTKTRHQINLTFGVNPLV